MTSVSSTFGLRDLLTRDVLERLSTLLDDDPDFVRKARHVRASFRIGDDRAGWVITVVNGRVIEFEEDENPAAAWDYEILAPLSDWEAMTLGQLPLMRALVPVFGNAAVRGDRVKAAGDMEALAHLVSQLATASNGAAAARQQMRLKSPRCWDVQEEVVGRYLDIDGVRTYFETIAAPTPRDVDFLVVHTAARDGRHFQPFASRLSAFGNVYIPDLPGHGKSWPRPGNALLSSMEELAAFVWAFRNAVTESTSTVVLGCSIGGNLVFSLAAANSADVSALVSFQGADFTPTQPKAMLDLMDHPHVNPAYSNIERTRSLIGARTSSEVAAFLEWETTLYTSPVLYSDLHAYGSFDVRHRMGEIECPALLVRGQDDWIVSDDMVHGTAERLANARLVEVVRPEGIGHFAPAEQPDEMAALVVDFLQRAGVIPGQ